MYRITMNGNWEYLSSTEIQWSRPLEPGTSYPVHITVFCWYRRSYSKSSSYSGHIQTLRKWNIFYILPSKNFSLMSIVKNNFNKINNFQVGSHILQLIFTCWQGLYFICIDYNFLSLEFTKVNILLSIPTIIIKKSKSVSITNRYDTQYLN